MRNVPLGVGSSESPIRMSTPRPPLTFSVTEGPSRDPVRSFEDDDDDDDVRSLPFMLLLLPVRLVPLPFKVVLLRVVVGGGELATTKAHVFEVKANRRDVTKAGIRRRIILY